MGQRIGRCRYQLLGPPAALMTTARPEARPSAITRPNGSGWVLAWTTMSSARMAAAGRIDETGQADPPGQIGRGDHALELRARVLAAGLS